MARNPYLSPPSRAQRKRWKRCPPLARHPACLSEKIDEFGSRVQLKDQFRWIETGRSHIDCVVSQVVV